MAPFNEGRSGPYRLMRAFAFGAAALVGSNLIHLSMANAADVPADPGPGGTAPVRPFRLDQVQLAEGLFQEKRDRMKAFLKEYDERRFLMMFNNQAGRPNPEGIELPGGWEDGGLLSGHWAGHYLTGLAQAYADQGEEVYKTKLDWMVKELAACQEAITARMDSPSKVKRADNSTAVGRVPGKFGNALRLKGSGKAQYVALPQETINQIKDFTIATWVNLADDDSWTRVFDFGRDTTTYMFLTPRGSSGKPRFAITTSGGAGEQSIEGDTAIAKDTWVHIAVTQTGSTGTLYVDGEVSGTNNALTLSPSNLNNPGNRWIGRSQYSDPMLNATIDEFHVFNRALSQEEIKSLLSSADGSTGGGNIAWYRFDEKEGTAVEDSSPNGRSAGIEGDSNSGDADWIPTHPGYLGALPEDTVLRLGPPRWAVYGSDKAVNTWAPWYTQHKILRGLLDAYYLTENKQAYDVVVKMADWAYLALTIGDKNQEGYAGNLTRADLNYMWDLYIAGEFGGANEVFPEIYQLTGDEKHLETAKAFDNRQSLFGAAVEDRDILVLQAKDNPGPRRPNRLHANTHVPQFIGYMRIFEHNAEQEYFDAAKNFYGWVVPHRGFATGGTGGNFPGSNNNVEMFQNRDNIANAIAGQGAETCTAYNMLKLARNLFMHEHNASYMDDYERGLFNMIAGSRLDTDATDEPQVTYFQPLSPAFSREYGNTGTCCGGTGMESHTKYQETVYLRSADGSALWVNLYIPSTLKWDDKGFEVIQETDFPRSGKAKFTVNGEGALDIKLRVPAWVQKGFDVTINGEAQTGEEAKPGTYLTLSRTWAKGDVIEIQMPFTIHVERALDRPDTQAIKWGPIVLQVVGSPNTTSGYWELSLYRYLKLDGDYSTAAITQTGTTSAGDPLYATAKEKASVRPYYISDTQPVSSYFRRVEPEVVFGSIDTGVANNKRNDTLPLYDIPVEGIQSPGSDGPTFLDLVWDGAPFASHNDFVDTVSSVADSFVQAGLYTSEERDTIVEKAGEAKEALAP